MGLVSEITDNRIVEKTIYSKLTVKQINEVIQLEIESHRLKYPDLKFSRVEIKTTGRAYLINFIP